eukprot:TRINITY_DN25401_c0_g1_i1.p1 TRINITY_DN25401_c0_g1~~TRINITY_DN25401_c0_g1_i1.p1  ORF type:complete len:311 (-),score=72.43 TRINITY_DN25401_c0_g1_i1:138-1070(-)
MSLFHRALVLAFLLLPVPLLRCHKGVTGASSPASARQQIRATEEVTGAGVVRTAHAGEDDEAASAAAGQAARGGLVRREPVSGGGPRQALALLEVDAVTESESAAASLGEFDGAQLEEPPDIAPPAASKEQAPLPLQPRRPSPVRREPRPAQKAASANAQDSIVTFAVASARTHGGASAAQGGSNQEAADSALGPEAPRGAGVKTDILEITGHISLPLVRLELYSAAALFLATCALAMRWRATRAAKAAAFEAEAAAVAASDGTGGSRQQAGGEAVPEPEGEPEGEVSDDDTSSCGSCSCVGIAHGKTYS